MLANKLRNKTSSMMLVGIACLSLSSMNTSISMSSYTPPPASSVVNHYGTDSDLVKRYPLTSKSFKVEQEANSLFGAMREATIEEQNQIQMNIDQISKNTGFNFWEHV